MKKEFGPPKLGQKILVIVDNAPSSLNLIRAIIESLPEISQTSFTLLHCCPTTYWEHSGKHDTATQQDIDTIWKAEDNDLKRSEQYLQQVRALLLLAGVPDYRIIVRTSTDDSLVTACLRELGRYAYSGVIVNQYHDDLVNRLLKKGVTDLFRRIPKVAVWAVDPEVFAEA